MRLRFPAYGNALWQRRLLNERPRVVYLLIGNWWRKPKWMPNKIPRLAVKTSAWSRAGSAGLESDPRLKEKARAAVRAAVLAGKLRPRSCELCGDLAVEAHHASYAEESRLAVRWLCRPHHDAEHTKEQAKKRDYDWRVVAAMTVLAIDVRDADERVTATDDWDEWFWLLAAVQRYARDIIMFTPTIGFQDPPDRFAPERTLEVYAWLNRRFDPAAGGWTWPPWWPYGDEILKREDTA